jgi:hypothetical protein
VSPHKLALMRRIDELLVQFGKAQLAEEHVAHTILVVLSGVDQCLLRNLSQHA